MEAILLHLSEWIGAMAVAMIAGISPRFQLKKLVFMYPRRDGMVALTIFIISGLLALLLAFSVLPFTLGNLPPVLAQRLLLAVGSLVPVGVALWRRKQPVRSAGWGRAKLSAALQLGLALAFLSIFLRGKFQAVINGLSGGDLSMLGYCLVVVALEETVFRGYIQPRLAGWWGETPGWLAASGLFVLVQLPRLWATPELLALNLLLLTGQSLAAGYVMRRSGHVLAPVLYRSVSDWLLFLS